MPGFRLGGGRAIVVHGCCPLQKRAGVVGPLVRSDAGAIFDVYAVVYVVPLAIQELRIHHPVPRPLGPVRVGLVSRVPGQTRGDVEETSLRDGVLVIEPVVPGEDLPTQATSAILFLPAGGLRVENGLGKRQPLWLALRRILEVVLGC